MGLLVPFMYQESIYTIPYQKLRENNVKCLLFDLDNTCVGYHEKMPTKKLKKLFVKLKKMGFQVILFSNASKRRLDALGELMVVKHPVSMKPFSFHFKKIMRTYHYQKEEVCMIGDQLFTDILGGNRVGIRTCYVHPITEEDFFVTKIFRAMERRMFRRMTKKGIWKKGEYYDEVSRMRD